MQHICNIVIMYWYFMVWPTHGFPSKIHTLFISGWTGGDHIVVYQSEQLSISTQTCLHLCMDSTMLLYGPVCEDDEPHHPAVLEQEIYLGEDVLHPECLF